MNADRKDQLLEQGEGCTYQAARIAALFFVAQLAYAELGYRKDAEIQRTNKPAWQAPEPAGDSESLPSQPEPTPIRCESYYSVKAGDTMGTIAIGNNVTLQELSDANPRPNINRVDIGEGLCIPE